MGSSKTRWKVSFRRSTGHAAAAAAAASPSTSVSTSSSFTAEMPVEFLCPISRSIMADPVIIPSGHTFERSCLQACLDLAFAPPDLSLDFQLALSSPPLLLIPNAALKSAIFAWCARCGLPPPLPIPPEAAVALVRRLMPQDQPSPAPSSIAPKDEEEDLRASECFHEEKVEEDDVLPSLAEKESKETIVADAPPPFSERDREKHKSSSFSSTSTPSSSTYHSSSSYSSSEIAIVDEAPCRERTPGAVNSPSRTTADALEDTLVKFRDLSVAEQEAAAASLRKATRESSDRRVSLCTLRLLGALRPMLLSPRAAVQVDSVAGMVNLSLEPANKARILRSGMVPVVIEVLRSGHGEASYHAAGALFALVLEDDNRAAIGVLGAIPPLLNLFTRPTDGARARRDAGMALYHLSLAVANRYKIARIPGAVHALLAVAAEKEEEEGTAPGEQVQGPVPASIAMMVIHNLAGCNEGRAALMDSGAVSALAALLSGPPLPAALLSGPPLPAAAVDHCVAALYWMSQGSLRFRSLAKAAAAEQALERVAEEGSGGVRQEMARRALRAMRGVRGDDASAGSPLSLALGEEADSDGASVVSDGLVSFRPRRNDFSDRSGGVSSAKFGRGAKASRPDSAESTHDK